MDSNDNAIPPSREAPTGPRPTAPAAEAAPRMLSATVETHGRGDLLAFDLTTLKCVFRSPRPRTAPERAGARLGRNTARKGHHRVRERPAARRHIGPHLNRDPGRVDNSRLPHTHSSQHTEPLSRSP